jgi:hypothetical protein
VAKGRMLNKKISYDEGVAKLSLEATLLYTWIIPHLDVKGRTYGDPNILKGIVPYIKQLTIPKIEKCLEEMVSSGLILLYGNGHKYLEFIGFTKNQNLNESREAESVIPAPELVQSNSCVTPAKVKIREDKIREGKEKHFDFVFLTNKELQELNQRFGVAGAKEKIANLNHYIGSKGDKYKSHFHTILSWDRKDKISTKPQGGGAASKILN